MRRNMCWNAGCNVKTNDKKRAGSRRAFAILLACLFLFSGCGKQDELEEDMSRVDTDISSDSDAGQETVEGQETVGIPEHLTYTLGTSGCKINVDADVTATGYQDMKVYEQNPGTVDDEYLKNLAEQIFDDGEYEVVKPYSICSMEELQEEDLFLQELYAEAGVEYHSSEVGLYIDEYNENYVAELPEETLIYYEEGYESCTLRGMVDGNVSKLCYESLDGYYSMIYVSRYAYNYDHLFMIYSTESNRASTLYGENLCDLEEASRTVQDVIDNMGYTDMKQLAAQHTVINDGTRSESSIYMDGYRFIFVRETDGIKNILGDDAYAVISDSVGEDISDFPGAGQEYISVDIDSTGIYRIFFGSRYEKGEQLSEKTTLLPFDQVDAVAQDYMNDLLESYNGFVSADFNIVEVRLGYVTLLYDTQYTLVPVWAYVQEKESEEQTLDSILFGVNALDGSIVQFTFDNEYGSPSQSYFY